MAAPELTIVIPALGNYGVLGRVLSGYARQDAGRAGFEVVVVADPADPDPDALRRAVGERPYPTRVLWGTRPGASANRNVGWRAAAASLVLFTDSDTIPAPQLVAEHLAWHRAHGERQTVVVGLVRWAPGIAVTPFMRWLEHGVQFDFDGIQGVEGSWAHVYSANCSVKRSFLEQVGGYDEQRFPYGYEDLDWGYRAREHGMRVLFNRRAVVNHWRTMTVEQWQVRAPRLAVSEWRFCERHPDVPPWFQQLFATAAAHPPGGRRSAAAARVIPRRIPWLGPLVWKRATLHWRQQIAPQFLAAWDAVAAGDAPALDPADAARRERAPR